MTIRNVFRLTALSAILATSSSFSQQQQPPHGVSEAAMSNVAAFLSDARDDYFMDDQTHKGALINDQFVAAVSVPSDPVVTFDDGSRLQAGCEAKNCVLVRGAVLLGKGGDVEAIALMYPGITGALTHDQQTAGVRARAKAGTGPNIDFDNERMSVITRNEPPSEKTIAVFQAWMEQRKSADDLLTEKQKASGKHVVNVDVQVLKD